MDKYKKIFGAINLVGIVVCILVFFISRAHFANVLTVWLSANVALLLVGLGVFIVTKLVTRAGDNHN